MEQITKPHQLREYSLTQKRQGERIALVPTMGALHEGHLSLIKKAQEYTPLVIVSIFVNPTQFGPGEDFESYPRQIEEDLNRLEDLEVSVVYTPGRQDMYPSHFSTKIHVSNISEGLCGSTRPGHFDGVATVVTKLLNQSQADWGIFGEKDYQQLCVIKRLVKDLDIPCKIIGSPIIRDKHGLALSSRNAYLSPNGLSSARQLNRILKQAAIDIGQGKDISETLTHSREKTLQAGFDKVDYLELREEETLIPVTNISRRAMRLLVAACIGQTRLIDNIRV